MTILIEAEQETHVTDRLTLRLVDQEGNVVFNRTVPENSTQSDGVFQLALHCAAGYYTQKHRLEP